MKRLIISILISISIVALDTSVYAQGKLSVGTVDTPDGVTIIVINKSGEQIKLQASETPAQLPVGRYRIDNWTMERTDEDGNIWKLTGNFFDEKGVFYVIEGQEVKLSIGEPIVPYLYASKSDSTYYLSHYLQGQLSETVKITKNGARSDAAKLQIANAESSYQDTLTLNSYQETIAFEYG